MKGLVGQIIQMKVKEGGKLKDVSINEEMKG